MSSTTMQAAVLYGREDLRLEEVRRPEPGPGEMVLRVGAALTCGTDLKVFRRGYHAAMLRPPMLFGHEVAGVVEAVGDGVSGFASGDRVAPMNSAPCDRCFFCLRGQQNLCEDLLFNNGAYAEFLRVPARIVEKNTLRVPDGMEMVHAALTEPLACVVRGLEESGLDVSGRGPETAAGQQVVVLGAGPIGLMFMHAAELAGAEVTAVVKRADQVGTAERFGARRVLRTEEHADIVAAVRAAVPGGRGADVVLEAVAQPLTWQWAVDMVRKGGVVNFFGGPPSGTTVALDTNRLHYGDITLKASFHHTPSTCRTAFALLRSGRFRAAEYVTGSAGLNEVPAVFRSMLHRSASGSTRDIKTAIFPAGGVQ